MLITWVGDDSVIGHVVSSPHSAILDLTVFFRNPKVAVRHTTRLVHVRVIACILRFRTFT